MAAPPQSNRLKTAIVHALVILFDLAQCLVKTVFDIAVEGDGDGFLVLKVIVERSYTHFGSELDILTIVLKYPLSVNNFNAASRIFP